MTACMIYSFVLSACLDLSHSLVPSSHRLVRSRHMADTWGACALLYKAAHSCDPSGEAVGGPVKDGVRWSFNRIACCDGLRDVACASGKPLITARCVFIGKRIYSQAGVAISTRTRYDALCPSRHQTCYRTLSRTALPLPDLGDLLSHEAISPFSKHSSRWYKHAPLPNSPRPRRHTVSTYLRDFVRLRCWTLSHESWANGYSHRLIL